MLSDIIRSSVTLFVILDVIGLIPIYLTILKKESKKVTDYYANKTTLFSGIILLIFIFFGSSILNFFSISIPDFKIAGGIILLILGIKFVLGLRVMDTDKHKKNGFAV